MTLINTITQKLTNFPLKTVKLTSYFFPKAKKIESSQFNGTAIDQVKCTTFLGINIDKHLCWSHHYSTRKIYDSKNQQHE